MKIRFLLSAFLVLSVLTNVDAQNTIVSPSEKEKILENIGNFPVTFRQNVGQWDDKILFQGSSPRWGSGIYFMKDQLSFGFVREEEEDEEEEHERIHHNRRKKRHESNKAEKSDENIEHFEYMVWNMRFKECNANAEILAEGKQDSRVNYMIGDKSKHRSNVPDFSVLTYQNIYDNISAKYYSTGRDLKYDFILKPGADISKIQLECDGVKNLRINEKGQMEIKTPWGILLEEIPESYQIIKGRKKQIKISYRKIDKNTFGFVADENYNPQYDLVIDPINFAWSTFAGGGPGADGYISEITVDPSGNVYGTGWYNAGFPTTPGSYDQSYNAGGGYGDAYVFKLNATASTMVYATYIGGATSYEQGQAIIANAAGEVYVCGWTQSTDFPTTAGAFNTAFNGTSFQDIVVFKLNATGSALVYSTFVGGMYSDYAYAMALDPSGNVYVTGYSTNFNLDFPTTPGAYLPSAMTSNGGVYVFKMNSTGSAMVYSTFTGNPSGRGLGIDVNTAGEAVLTGFNYGNMDITPGVFNPTPNVNIGIYPDAFAQKINPTGTSLVYSTYLGGDNWEEGNGIAMDLSGNAYVTGFTGSLNFPTTAGAFDVTQSGGSDPWLLKLNTAGTALVYATFLAQDGIGYSVAVNYQNEVFFAGNMNSQGFTATPCAFDATYNGATDNFMGKLDATGSVMLFETYVGGTASDYGNGPFGKVKIVISDPCEEKVYVCTTSHSTDFPTTAGTYQSVKANSGADQPVVYHIKPTITPLFTYTVNPCNNVDFTDVSTGNCIWQAGPWSPTQWQWNFGDGGTSTTQNPSHTYGAPGTYNVQLIVGCPKDSITIPVTVSAAGLVLAMSSTPAGCGINNGSATVNVTTGTGPFTYTWTPTGGNAATANALGAGNYTVTVSNGACTNTDSVVVALSGVAPVTSAITGPNPVCPNATGIVYSVTNTIGSVYAWTVPAGATITAGQGTNSITVDFGASGGTISVTETNACGTGTAVTTLVNTSTTPVTSVITGPSPLCPNATGQIYYVVNTSGSTYAWTVPAGATITAGQGTNSITVTFGANGGTISCTETSTCGTGVPVTTTIVMNAAPATGAISGTTPVCPNAINIVYTVNNTAGSTYNWSVPAGATIASGQGTNSIFVNWGTTGGNISVTETNSCGTGTAVIYPVTIFPLPSTSPITGGNPSCANTSGIVYSVTNTPGNTYVWSVPAGATIVSGQGTNSITLNWGANGGTITCTESNSCGAGAPVTINVSFSSPPVTSTITGVSPLCPNQTGTVYTVTNNIGSTYAWTVPVGAFIVSGQGTNSIIVNWGTTGGNVSCTETNMCGSGATVSYPVIINSLPATGAISGPTPLCANSTAQTYSVTNTTGSTYTWLVPAGATIVSGQGSSSISVNWGSTGGTISVTETNACGTGTAVTYSVTLLAAPTVSFVGDTLSGCAPLTVDFTDNTIVTGGTITNWNWVFGDGNTSNLQNPTNTYLNSGAYNISLTVTSSAGCSATYNATNYVNVYPNPIANFTSNSGDVSVSDPTIIYTDLSTSNIINWLWNFGDGSDTTIQNPSHIYPEAGVYSTTLTVTNQYGCMDDVTQTVEIKDEFTFFIPNSFTPDGDNLNDYFRGEGKGIKTYHLEIYDRWGERFFTSDDWNNPWTGATKKSDRLVQIDVYVYKIVVVDIFNLEHKYVGHVSVVR
ncbi:MAG: PKD domain-containing protein [Bacteroidia bacterium]|nr:PKD domain-containing protein [Bacteroidia bacterium]